MDDKQRDHKLDTLLADAARTYRVPPDAPLDALWAGIEREAFTPPVTNRRGAPGWRVLGVAIAASLVLGVSMGRLSVRTGATTGPAVASPPTATLTTLPAAQSASAPYHRETEVFLGNTALLLAALPRKGSQGQAPSLLPEQATQLLNTTRLLLDSPVGTDPRMRELLQDLELVLAQVARLQPRRQNVELTMISQTLEERDLVPRIRSAVTDLSASDY